MAERLSAPFVIERRFNAPRELVYAALTQAEHLRRWMSPPGMTMSHCKVDARPGGVFHYDMRPAGAPPEAPGMWGKWTFRELVPPERIVVVVNFSDAAGGVTRHPMAPQWPLFTLSTTTLREVPGGTLMHLEWCALDAAAEEQAIFDASHASMTQGWSGTMEHLDRHLAAVLDDALAERTHVSLAVPEEIVTTRVVAAPLARVWQAFTTPDQLAQWWGPMGFSTTTQTMDLRTGGHWRHVMRGPDGVEYANHIAYTEVVPLRRLAWNHGTREGEVLFRATVEFEARGERTHIRLCHHFPSGAARDHNIRTYGSVQGAIDTTNRLVAFVAGQPSSDA